ncbi:MAG: hypothetical protein HQL50_12335 [Magnetococcales bacterium]|nr:hypothetical protein [Magnetococcales bacterium]
MKSLKEFGKKHGKTAFALAAVTAVAVAMPGESLAALDVSVTGALDTAKADALEAGNILIGIFASLAGVGLVIGMIRRRG